MDTSIPSLLKSFYEPVMGLYSKAWNGGHLNALFSPWALQNVAETRPALAHFLNHIKEPFLSSYARLVAAYPPIPDALPEPFHFEEDIKPLFPCFIWLLALATTVFTYICEQEAQPFKTPVRVVGGCGVVP